LSILVLVFGAATIFGIRSAAEYGVCSRPHTHRGDHHSQHVEDGKHLPAAREARRPEVRSFPE
jgi:hypothetical protein